MPFTTMVTYYIKNPDFWFHWLDSILSSKFSNNVCFFCRLNYTKIHISVYLYIYIYRLTKPSKFIIKGSFIERRYEPKKNKKRKGQRSYEIWSILTTNTIHNKISHVSEFISIFMQIVPTASPISPTLSDIHVGAFLGK